MFYDHILEAGEQTPKTAAELLREVRAEGIEAVEIRLEHLERETWKLLQSCDLKVSCIYEFFEMDKRNEGAKVKKLLETAAELRTEKVLIVPGFVSHEEAAQLQSCMKDDVRLAAFLEKNSKTQRMAEGLSYAAKVGAEMGVQVTVEDFDDGRSPLYGRRGVRWFLDRIPELQYTMDLGNFVGNEEDVRDAWELLQDRVVHVHCKDRGEEQEKSADKQCLNRGLAPAAVGSGYLPIAELLCRLKEKGYDGYLAIEHFGAEDQEAYIRKSAEFLRTYL